MLAFDISTHTRIIAGTISRWCQGHPGHGYASQTDLKLIEEAAINIKRDNVGPCGVPQCNYDLCNGQATSQAVSVFSSILSLGVPQFANIPSACMVLAVALSGSCSGDGARPIPCGSACMQYQGLSDDQFRVLSSYLDIVNGV
ncbi:hypothetical protein B0T18DRAFT_438658 [Schizothecium vesticola]|uniref:Uncharacterized protein n=1 Tax=Schizothecium vesticola TaxID=314040 RepID=A0AA40EWI6_9PEZI|nr:hypothetical protein B0T18DRAFT_438658 [Schizothecium vesticola]